MNARCAATALVLAALMAGCEAGTTIGPDGPLFNNGKKGGGGGSSEPSTISVRIDWDDDLVVQIGDDPVTAGIIGDGRGTGGDAEAGGSAYQDGVCGVNADIYSNGDLIFDTYAADECGDLRVHSFRSGLTADEWHTLATKTVARGLGLLDPVGSFAHQWEGFHFAQPQCDRVVYGAEYHTDSDDPKQTRLDDAPDGARRWRVESQGSHRAVCVYWSKGKDRVGVLTDPMPFAYTVTEILP